MTLIFGAIIKFNVVAAASDEVTSWTESWTLDKSIVVPLYQFIELECRSWHIWFILLEY